MWTIQYKGYFIHGYCDRSECLVINPSPGLELGMFKSLHAAKIAVTRDIKA